MTANYDLERFVEAQKGIGPHSSYETALEELRAERKTTHWIWYVLPQSDGLSQSEMGHRYGIVDLEEAKAYLAHPVLGPRLREALGALADAKATGAADILGEGDARKLQSTLTLFHRAAPNDALFTDLLGKYYGGDEDQRTLALI